MYFKNKSNQNTISLGIVELFWGIGMNFISMSAILPVMLKHLNATHIEIGLIPSIGSLGFGLPQILSPKLFGQKKSLRKIVLYLHILTSLPLLVLAFSLFIKVKEPLMAILLCWSIYCFLVGVVFPLWMNYMAKITNPENRGNSFGIIFFCQTMAGALGVFLAGKIYGAQFDYNRSALIFFIAFSSMFLGSFFFLLTKEEGFEEGKKSPFISLKELLKKYNWLAYYILSRILSRGALLVMSSFYIVDIIDKNLKTSQSAVAIGSIALISQALSSIFLGKIGDSLSHKNASLIAVSIFFLSSISFIFQENLLIHIMTAMALGLYISSEFTSFNNLMFSLSETYDRHSIIAWTGFLNTIPQMIIPLLGGFIIDIAGMVFAALFSALLLFLSILVLYFFVPKERINRN